MVERNDNRFEQAGVVSWGKIKFKLFINGSSSTNFKSFLLTRFWMRKSRLPWSLYTSDQIFELDSSKHTWCVLLSKLAETRKIFSALNTKKILCYWNWFTLNKKWTQNNHSRINKFSNCSNQLFWTQNCSSVTQTHTHIYKHGHHRSLTNVIRLTFYTVQISSKDMHIFPYQTVVH